MKQQTYDIVKDTTLYRKLDELVRQRALDAAIADNIKATKPDSNLYGGSTLTVHTTDGGLLPSLTREERSNKAMAKRLVYTLVRQYAPDADTAWDWMRKAHEMGWEWGNHMLGGPSASDPLGQRVSKSIATSFTNGAGVYVGIALVSGEVRWGWFRAKEWGPRGRDLVLAGNRSHHPDPISAITEYTLLGEATPKGTEPLDDVFEGQWDD